MQSERLLAINMAEDPRELAVLCDPLDGGAASDEFLDLAAMWADEKSAGDGPPPWHGEWLVEELERALEEGLLIASLQQLIDKRLELFRAEPAYRTPAHQTSPAGHKPDCDRSDQDSGGEATTTDPSAR